MHLLDFGSEAERNLGRHERPVARSGDFARRDDIGRQRPLLLPPPARPRLDQRQTPQRSGAVRNRREPGVKEFLAKIARGESFTKQVRRLDTSGREKWLDAYDYPVFVGSKLRKVVEVGIDITAAKQQALENAGKLEAISRAQAIIEYSPTEPSSS